MWFLFWLIETFDSMYYKFWFLCFASTDVYLWSCHISDLMIQFLLFLIDVKTVCFDWILTVNSFSFVPVLCLYRLMFCFITNQLSLLFSFKDLDLIIFLSYSLCLYPFPSETRQKQTEPWYQFIFFLTWSKVPASNGKVVFLTCSVAVL